MGLSNRIFEVMFMLNELGDTFVNAFCNGPVLYILLFDGSTPAVRNGVMQ